MLADDPGWASDVARRRAAGISAAFLLDSGPDGLAHAEEMAGELGRGEPWHIDDKRGEKPGAGMSPGI